MINTIQSEYSYILKADQLHPRYYPHTPPDYRHTDLRLVMTFIALCCSAVRALTDRRTDRRYQVHYLPRFVVDKKVSIQFTKTLIT